MISISSFSESIDRSYIKFTQEFLLEIRNINCNGLRDHTIWVFSFSTPNPFLYSSHWNWGNSWIYWCINFKTIAYTDWSSYCLSANYEPLLLSSWHVNEKLIYLLVLPMFAIFDQSSIICTQTDQVIDEQINCSYSRSRICNEILHTKMDVDWFSYRWFNCWYYCPNIYMVSQEQVSH